MLGKLAQKVGLTQAMEKSAKMESGNQEELKEPAEDDDSPLLEADSKKLIMLLRVLMPLQKQIDNLVATVTEDSEALENLNVNLQLGDLISDEEVKEMRKLMKQKKDDIGQATAI